MDRGTGSMKGLLSTVLFSIGPALFDVLVAAVYLSTEKPWMAVIVIVSISIYVPVTIYITEYRGSLRREMNSQDNKKSSRVRALSSLRGSVHTFMM
jgi:ATP-binding cassette subfamily B (MDR/TAP) protein 6